MEYENILTEVDFRHHFDYRAPPKESFSTKLKNAVRCNKNRVVHFFLSFFPIITWLPAYKIKQYLPGDLIGGVTTAIVRIPQSLAYGLLAGLQPINGMYVAFFAPLTYLFLGTSRHVSVGTFAVISLMLGSALEKYVGSNPFPTNNTNLALPTTTTAAMATASIPPGEIFSTSIVSTTAETISSDETAYKLAIVGSLTILTGLIQIALGIFKLGFVAVFLSDPLVSGFTTGAALFVITAQVKYFFGIPIPRQQAPFALVKTYVALFERIGETNVAEIVLSIVSIVLLYPVKLINEKYKKKLHNIPIPIEFIVVVITTVVSATVDFKGRYGIDVVGAIPSGLPTPRLPSASTWGSLIADAFSIAVVSFAITVSIGKLFAKKHGYKVSPNQELFALGVSQLTCGIFQGHACSGALARSTVKESSGTKTQFSDVVSCVVILLVLLLIGQYLSALPKACLSAIIVVNIRSLLRQFLVLPRLWSLSKPDFVVWVITFVAVVLLGVDLGLAVGVLGLLVTVVLSVYKPHVTVRGGLGNTDIYRDIEKFGKAREVPGIKIVRFPQSPFFGNVTALQTLSSEAMFINKACANHKKSEDHLVALLDDHEEYNEAEPSNRVSPPATSVKTNKDDDVTDTDNDVTDKELEAHASSSNLSSIGTQKSTGCRDDDITKSKSSLARSLHDVTSDDEAGEDSVVVMDVESQDVHFSNMNGQGGSAKVKLLKRHSPDRVSFNPKHCFHTIIFDCSGWTFIDLMGMETVRQICTDFKANKLHVYLASVQPGIMAKLIKVGVVASRDDEEGLATVFPSVRFAVEAAKRSKPLVASQHS